MLTTEQYLVLKKYRDSFVRAPQKPDEATAYLFQQGLIQIKRFEYDVEHECKVSYIKTLWELTPLGIQALNEFENSLQKDNDIIAKEQAIKKADRRFNLFNTVLGAVWGALLALAAEHLPEIFEFFVQYFH